MYGALKVWDSAIVYPSTNFGADLKSKQDITTSNNKEIDGTLV